MHAIGRIVTFFVAALLPLLSAPQARAQEEDKVYSGPQKGERLLPFKVRGIYDPDDGKELDFIERAKGQPLLLIFVHKLTRPAFGLVRMLTGYAKTRGKDGLHAAIVWLADDRSEAERYLKKARASLAIEVPVGISLDGAEGPGAYGLNRKVTLTIIVSKENRVTANFALVQPSDTDAPRILEEIVRLVGGKPPTVEELRRNRRPASRGGMMAADPALRRLFRYLARRDASPEQVQGAARRVEAWVGERRRRQLQLGTLASNVTGRKDFSQHGTPRAREHFRAWAKKYGPKPGKFAGTWKSAYSFAEGRDFENDLVLRVEKGTLVGTQKVQGESKEIRDVRFGHDRVSFTLLGELRGRKLTLKFEGRLRGDTIRGQVRLSLGERSRNRDWEARRIRVRTF